MLVVHYGIIISLFVTFMTMSLSIAVVSFNKFRDRLSKEAMTLLCTFGKHAGSGQSTEEVREMVGIVQNGRWHDSFSSVFYTLIKHALSTHESARHIRTLL